MKMMSSLNQTFLHRSNFSRFLHSFFCFVFVFFAYMYSLVLLKLAPQRANPVFREEHIYLFYNATSMRSRENMNVKLKESL